MEAWTWAGISLCLLHSAMFSGLNLALMGLGRLRLEAEALGGNPSAAKVLALRQDSNFLLTTLLWGNVGVNVLLTLLSDSVMAGVTAFLFSTFGITILGEIAPQALFSRNALRAGALFAPVVRFYQLLLYPIAKPAALVLDRWLGPEAILYLRERDLRELIGLHAVAADSDVGRLEAQGALNFLALDDLSIAQEGEPIHPKSIVPSERANTLPHFEATPNDGFLRNLQASGEKWIVLVDRSGEPGLVIDADGFLRGALLEGAAFSPARHCHRPLVVRDPATRLGHLLHRLRVEPSTSEDDVIDRDVILLWTPSEKRVLTGADILGRLLRGIATRGPVASMPEGGHRRK
jgi:metal transporter CNNM